jgi:uncharacterized integral membrane protein
MDVFATSLLIFVLAFLGAILAGGLIAFVQIRKSRRERLQMKRHVNQIGVGGTA